MVATQAISGSLFQVRSVVRRDLQNQDQGSAVRDQGRGRGRGRGR